MKKYIAGAIILIVFLTMGFILKVDVAVLLRGQGKNSLGLNNKTYLMRFRAPGKFNGMSLRFLTNAKPAGGAITINIYDDVKAEDPLVSQVIKETDVLAHGQFYKFDFQMLNKSDSYFLQVKGAEGVRYILRYDSKTGTIFEDGEQKQGKIAYKLHSRRTVSQVAVSAANKAASDWFKLGPAYILSILAYIALLSLLLGTLLFRSELGDDEKA